VSVPVSFLRMNKSKKQLVRWRALGPRPFTGNWSLCLSFSSPHRVELSGGGRFRHRQSFLRRVWTVRRTAEWCPERKRLEKSMESRRDWSERAKGENETQKVTIAVTDQKQMIQKNK
jgi:hypothetical protein